MYTKMCSQHTQDNKPGGTRWIPHLTKASKYFLNMLWTGFYPVMNTWIFITVWGRYSVWSCPHVCHSHGKYDVRTYLTVYHQPPCNAGRNSYRQIFVLSRVIYFKAISGVYRFFPDLFIWPPAYFIGPLVAINKRAFKSLHSLQDQNTTSQSLIYAW